MNTLLEEKRELRTRLVKSTEEKNLLRDALKHIKGVSRRDHLTADQKVHLIIETLKIEKVKSLII